MGDDARHFGRQVSPGSRDVRALPPVTASWYVSVASEPIPPVAGDKLLPTLRLRLLNAGVSSILSFTLPPEVATPDESRASFWNILPA